MRKPIRELQHLPGDLRIIRAGRVEGHVLDLIWRLGEADSSTLFSAFEPAVPAEAVRQVVEKLRRDRLLSVRRARNTNIYYASMDRTYLMQLALTQLAQFFLFDNVAQFCTQVGCLADPSEAQTDGCDRPPSAAQHEPLNSRVTGDADNPAGPLQTRS